MSEESGGIWTGIVAGACILVVVAIWIVLVFVVPVFGEMFADFGAELPGPTMLVLNLSGFLRTYFLGAAVLLCALIGLVGYAYSALRDSGDRTIAVTGMLGTLALLLILLCVIVAAMFLPVFRIGGTIGGSATESAVEEPGQAEGE